MIVALPGLLTFLPERNTNVCLKDASRMAIRVEYMNRQRSGTDTIKFHILLWTPSGKRTHTI